MRSIIIPVIVLLLVGGGISHWYFSEYNIAKRQLSAALDTISRSANAMAQKELISQIDQYLAEDATVNMDVKFSLFGRGSSTRRWTYQHNKEQFAAFITQMTGKVKSYGMRFTLKELTMDEGSTDITATVRASGFATAHAVMIARKTATRFIIKADCTLTGTVDSTLTIQSLNCPINLSQQVDLNSEKLRDALNELMP